MPTTGPQRIGRYVIERRLGAGGMGAVYLAHSPAGLRVAVKVVHPEIAADPDFRRRFHREIEAVRAIGPLYTAPVVDADPDAATPWFAAVYLDGVSLHDRVERNGPLTVPAVRTLAAGLAEALAAVHAAGVVHRDLKPANVILMPDGPRIIDFGIARMATSNSLTSEYIGTLAYSSPEHFEPARLGPPSDIYCLGATLHYAATGHSPVGDGTMHEVVGRIIQGKLDLSRLPAALRPVVVRCLHSEPGRRPTASALAGQLTDAGTRSPDPAAVPSPDVTTDRPTAIVRRRPRTAAGRWVPAVLAVAVAVAGAIAWYGQSSPGAAPRTVADQPVTPQYPGQPPRLVLKAAARALAFSPDGATIASGGTDGTVTLWDRATGDRRTTLDAAPFGVLALAYSPDGRYVAARGTGDYVAVWNVATGHLIHRYDGGNGPIGEVGTVAFAPDGRSVAATEYTGTLVHDLSTGHTTDYPVAGDWVAVAAGFDPHGRLLIVADHSAVTAWRLADGSSAWRRDLPASTALAVGGDGVQFALGDDSGVVTLRSMLSGEPVTSLYPRRGSIRSLAYDSAHGRLVTGLDGGVEIWSVFTGRLLESLPGGPGPVLSVAFSPTGTYVAACEPTGDIRLWDVP